MSTIRFWFEFASTYSYLAAMRVDAQAKAWGVPVAWTPFLLGPIFGHQGWNDSPYNLNPARGRYMWRDVARTAASYGLPFQKPSQFPRNSVLAARVACVAGEDWLPDFARAVYRANFEQDRDIGERAVIEEVLRGIGRDPEATLALALSPENKGKLREQTDRAWELGICGAPTFEVNGELFWGNDRMEQAFAWYAQLPMACDLTALDAGERKTRAELADRLKAGTSDVRELPNGFALRVPSTAMSRLEIEALAALEGRCCPFLTFAAREDGGDTILEITGCADAKQFLRGQAPISSERNSG